MTCYDWVGGAAVAVLAFVKERQLRQEPQLRQPGVGCPSCGVRDPLECSCTQEERFRAAQANGEINPWG